MTSMLADLIEQNLELLVDGITKEAIQHIPSYGRAPIKQTMTRVEQWLGILVESIRRNNPNVLEQYLMGIAEDRRGDAYPLGELHAIFDITKQHLRDLVVQATPDEVERNARLALVDATMAAAHIIMNKAYLWLAGARI